MTVFTGRGKRIHYANTGAVNGSGISIAPLSQYMNPSETLHFPILRLSSVRP